MPKIGFVGLTHLGIVSAVSAASKGFTVSAVQDDLSLVKRLNCNQLPIEEPGLDDLLNTHRPLISFSTEFKNLEECDIIYIAVDVPTDDNGTSDLGVVEHLINKTINVLKDQACLIVLCQVPPGFTRKINLPPERLYYQVETLVFGSAVERATNPERFIIGSSQPNQAIAQPVKKYLDAFDCPILPMQYESAELAKISINMCLVASVSVANMMADLSSRLGADWMEIVPALKLDKRIGAFAYLNPGLGISGGNLERDLATVISLASESGAQANVASQYLVDSQHRKKWVLRTLHESGVLGISNPKIGILGLAYKENTTSTKNSPAIEVIKSLPSATINVFDPLIKPEGADKNVPWDFLISHQTAEAVFSGADAILILTPWPEFDSLDISHLSREMNGKTIIDPFRMINTQICTAQNLDHHSLGRTKL
jgi:UDPglucose 6-dehydrogenase